MKDKNYIIGILSLFCLLLLSLFFNYKQHMDLHQQQTKIKEKIVVKYVEKKDSMPDAKKETVVGMIKIPVSKQNMETMISENLSESVLDSVVFPDTTDSIEVPRTQKVYSDSTYTAYVSGHEPWLDSIFVRHRNIEHSIVETVPAKQFRRWNVGLIGGYGYGFTSKKFEPFVGIGLTVSIF